MSEVMEKLGEFVDKTMDAMYEKGKRDNIDVVLEIIDKHIEAVERSDGKDSETGRGQIGIATCIRHEVERMRETLKGGEHENCN